MRYFTPTTTKQFLCVAALALCLATAGCSGKQFGRELENAMGSLARQPVESLGSPDKKVSLVKLRVTGEYAIVLPKLIIHMGEEFTQVRVPKQFSDSGFDYAIIECAQEDGSLKNLLLRIPSNPSNTNLFVLDSATDKPFSVDPSGKTTVLLQDRESPATVSVWLLEYTGVRGPVTVAREKIYGSTSKKTRVTTSRSAKGAKTDTVPPRLDVPPAINPAVTIRLEPDVPTPQAEERATEPASTSKASSKTTIVLDDGGATPPVPGKEPTPSPLPSGSKNEDPAANRPIIVIP